MSESDSYLELAGDKNIHRANSEVKEGTRLQYSQNEVQDDDSSVLGLESIRDYATGTNQKPDVGGTYNENKERNTYYYYYKDSLKQKDPSDWDCHKIPISKLCEKLWTNTKSGLCTK